MFKKRPPGGGDPGAQGAQSLRNPEGCGRRQGGLTPRGSVLGGFSNSNSTKKAGARARWPAADRADSGSALVSRPRQGGWKRPQNSFFTPRIGGGSDPSESPVDPVEQPSDGRGSILNPHPVPCPHGPTRLLARRLTPFDRSRPLHQ